MAEILFLVHRAPWPPDRGDRIRSWHMFEALARLAPVHIAALADNEADAAVAWDRMAPLCKTLAIEVRNVSRPVALAHAVLRGEPVSNRLFRNAALAEHVGALLALGTVTHIVAFSGQMAQYLPDDFAGPVLMDFVDVDSAKFATYAEQDKRQPLNWVHAREAKKLGAFEAKVARAVDASLFVSEAEAALFRQCSGLGADKVCTVENGIDTACFDPALPFDEVGAGEGPLIVFTGQMDYRPNIDAVHWFVADSLPLVRNAYADARFAIVGRAPTEDVRALGALPGVIVTGEVPTCGRGSPRPMPSSRRCCSRAVCRTSSSKRWRWRGRWSRVQLLRPGSMRCRANICSSPMMPKRWRPLSCSCSTTGRVRRRWEPLRVNA